MTTLNGGGGGGGGGKDNDKRRTHDLRRRLTTKRNESGINRLCNSLTVTNSHSLSHAYTIGNRKHNQHWECAPLSQGSTSDNEIEIEIEI